MAEGRRSRSTEAFFGRRQGRPIRPLQTSVVDRLLPVLRLDLSARAPAALAGLFRAPVGNVRLEIGFGGGEHLHHEASRQPDTGFIGVEPFVNGVAKMVMALDQQPLENVRIYDDDATRVLDWLPRASIAGIDLLYPDPWPKKRHWKRRFVNRQNLDRFACVLKPGGLFRFASDIDSYVDWTLLHCRAHPQFKWVAHSADDWRNPYEGWPGTRYEAKAIREDRTPAYLTFQRV